MFISAKPQRTTLHQSSDGECLLIFTCEPRDDSGVLEIGSDHVFASKKNLGLINRRRSVGLVVRVRRMSGLNDTAITNLNLSSAKVGELTFCPVSAYEGATASLEADLFIADEFFENNIRALTAGKKSQSLQIDIDDQQILKYGWEHDGSRKEWKLQNQSDISTVAVSKLSLSFELIE